MESLIEKINRENAERFGSICEECELFEKFCRCESTRIYKLKLKEAGKFDESVSSNDIIEVNDLSKS